MPGLGLAHLQPGLGRHRAPGYYKTETWSCAQNVRKVHFIVCHSFCLRVAEVRADIMGVLFSCLRDPEQRSGATWKEKQDLGKCWT